MRRLLVAAAAILALTVAVPSVAASSPRSGDLHIQKECHEYTGLAGGFCTITSSNLAAIPVGSKVIYLSDKGATVLDTDIALDPPGPGNNVAFGHVYLDLTTYVGTVTFAGGTGRFTWFKGSAAVTLKDAATRSWHWNGTYRFDPPGD